MTRKKKWLLLQLPQDDLVSDFASTLKQQAEDQVLSAVCCLLSAVCCLLSAVCCLLSAVCCLLSAIRYLLPTV
jgi:hypothetical protein